MKKIKHLFFDFDGFLFDTFEMFAHYYREKYQIPIKASDFYHTKNAYELVSSYKSELDKHLFYMSCNDELLVSHDWHKDVRPYADASFVLSLLREEYVLHVVTARQSTGHDVVKNLCEKYFPGCISEFHYAWYREKEMVIERPKREYLDSHGERGIFFDDTPEEVLNAQGLQNVHSVLFDPYDMFSYMETIPRVNSFKKILEYVQHEG